MTAFGMVVTLLETVQKVKENRDNLKEVCVSASEIVQHVNSAIAFHGDAMAERFKDLCGELCKFLEDIQQRVAKWDRKRTGFKGRLREVLKADNMGTEFLGYKERIKELRANFMMVGMIDANVGITKVDKRVTSIDEKLSALTLSGGVFNRAVLPLKECPPPSPIFHGRRNVLDQMHTYFAQNLGHRHVYVLYGLGGAGKTQTALKFIQENSQRFSQVFFIDTTTLGTIHLSFQSLAAATHAGTTTEDALQWLIGQQTEWLLLLNNADDVDINLQQFIPHCTHGNIIITTRNPELCVHANGPDSQHRLSDMEEADAIELLLRAGRYESTPENMQVASNIVQTLHNFPLAVVQAGAFIYKHQCLKHYLDMYRTNKTRLLKERPAQTHDDYAWTVYTTWQISFDHLSKPAAQLLQLCSFLHHEGITESIFSNAAICDWTDLGEVGLTAEDVKDAQEFLAKFTTPSGVWDRFLFTELTAELRGYSLIELDLQEETYSMHPLVQDWTQSSLTDGHHDCMCIVAIIGMSVPQGEQLEDYQFQIQLLPHVDSLLSNPTAKKSALKFQFTFGCLYQVGGRPAEAEALLSKYATKVREQLGVDHLDALRAMSMLAMAYRDLGQSQEAADLYTMVLEKRKRILGEEHRDTLITMGNLAALYSNLGKSQEAAELKTIVLEKRKKLLGEEHPDTLSAMGNLASSYHDLGQSQEAAELNTMVFEKRKKLLGEEHPNTLNAMANLARSYNDIGRLREAADLEAMVLEKRKKLLGEEHPDTLFSMGNLARSYNNLGRSKEAADLETMVLEKRKTLLGEEHPDTLLAMGNLAVSYHDLGRLQEAADLEAMVLEKRKKLLGEEHPNSLLAMANLAASYGSLGRVKEAADLETIVLEKRKKLLGEEHPDTLFSMGNLAGSYHNLGRSKEAADLETMVLEKRKTLLGEEHPDTLLAMGNLASSYNNLGQSKEAADLEAIVLEKRKKILGEEHPRTLLAMANLAVSYRNLGRLKEAADLEAMVLEKRKRLLGEGHPDTLLAMGNLARSYSALGRLREAADLETIVLEKRKQILGENHPHTLQTMANLAALYGDLGRSTDAAELETMILGEAGGW
ncbi:hypothetical protein DFH07DRAFT_931688 [Mycena maculata]|uniref:DUF7779 domain-containing protein n=1 Tax=Mycena maculata TaxID=230809 RepID=A0AAD7HNE2_9AGAR|nr:hypothetical protein DFH07DRAFT_931688 [Mycena maculata]